MASKLTSNFPSLAARENPKAGICMIIASTALLSVVWMLVKALSDRYPIAEVSFFRSLFGFVPVGMVVARQGGLPQLQTERLPGHVWRSVIGVTALLLTTVSYHLLPMADAAALSFTSPLLVTALSAPLLGERVGFQRWNAVILGFLGVLVIIQPGGGMLNISAMAALSGALGSALVMITVRQLNRTEKPITIVFYYTLFTSLFTGLPLPFIWEDPTWQDWGLLVASGLIGGAAQICMTAALGLARAAVISPFNYVSLLWAGLFGWLFWGDVPAPHVFLGSLVVVVSGLFILYGELRKDRVG